MRTRLSILFLGLFLSASGQKQFDHLQVEKVLTALPRQVNQVHFNDNIIKSIEAVDRKYRVIADTLFSYKSRRHTIIQTVLIETNDSTTINPLTFGDKLETSNIIFYNQELNTKVTNIAKDLNKKERNELYEFLETNFDHFSTKEKKLKPQPVRIKYINFSNSISAKVGIDIYGTHFLWTIDRTSNWDVVKVERLWVY
jgi:hypothetical protein